MLLAFLVSPLAAFAADVVTVVGCPLLVCGHFFGFTATAAPDSLLRGIRLPSSDTCHLVVSNFVMSSSELSVSAKESSLVSTDLLLALTSSLEPDAPFLVSPFSLVWLFFRFRGVC